MRLLGVLVVLAACHTSGGGQHTPDAATDDADGGGGRLGLFVAWEPDPQVPGPLTKDITTSEVAFAIRSLQFLSDVGDASRGNLSLRWNSEIEPLETTLPTAPAGLYSQISIHLGGGSDAAYRIIGTWHDDDGGETRTFRIEDTAQTFVMLDCAKLLAAAGSTEVAIKIDLRDALGQVRFDGLPKDETGTYVLDQQTDAVQLAELRKRIPLAFRLDN
jgi:hypothetical protein